MVDLALNKYTKRNFDAYNVLVALRLKPLADAELQEK